MTTSEPAVGVRIGGQPVTVLDDLRSPELLALLTGILRADAAIAARATELADTLYPVIGAADGHRSTLVALRRALHNHRLPGERLWNAETRALLPAGLTEDIQEWCDLVTAQRARRAGVDDAVAGGARAEAAALRKAVADPWFRHGLLLGSPVLYGQLEKWLARPDGTTPDRQLALRLTKYLSRAAVKTSPFSTFTISGLGAPGGEPVDRLRVTTTVEANLWFLRQVSRRLVTEPEFAATTVLRRNPSATLTDGRWEFLAPEDNEPLRGLPAGPAVAACLDVVADEPTLVVARERLAGKTGAGAEKAAAFLGKLVEVGLLECLAPIADQEPDQLGRLTEWVATGGPRWAPLAEALGRISTALDGYPAETDPAARLRRVTAVERAMADARGALGGAEVPAKNAVIENAVVLDPVPGPEWTDVVQDLEVVRRLQACLDPALPARVAVADVFAARLGEGASVGFLAFHRAVQEWAQAEPALQAALAVGTQGFHVIEDVESPRLRRLSELRTRLCDLVNGTAPDADGTVRMAGDRLLAETADWPQWMVPLDSMTAYGQVSPDGFVLNSVNSGHGRGRDRVHRMLAQTGEPPRPVERVDGLVADTCFSFGANVGLRDSAVPFEIDYPGGRSSRPPEERIPLSELRVVHDPGAGLLRLWSAERAAEVAFVHPNLVAEMWMPPALRLLLQVFGVTPYLLVPGRRMFGDSSITRVSGVRAEPRVALGSVVVSRAQWVFPVREFPARAKGETDGAYLLRLTAWRVEHRVPDRCFVRGLDPEVMLDGNLWRTKSRKPQYVDFASLSLVGLFERMLGGPEQLIFLQEALPDPGDAPSYGDDGRRNTEHLIEISGGNRD